MQKTIGFPFVFWAFKLVSLWTKLYLAQFLPYLLCYQNKLQLGVKKVKHIHLLGSWSLWLPMSHLRMVPCQHRTHNTAWFKGWNSSLIPLSNCQQSAASWPSHYGAMVREALPLSSFARLQFQGSEVWHASLKTVGFPFLHFFFFFTSCTWREIFCRKENS